MADETEKKWERLDAPPAPLFMGKPERDFIHQVNSELIERVIGQEVVYYAINHELTNYHPLYGEAIQKFFHDPIHIHALVKWEGQETEVSNYGIDRRTEINVYFHRKRIVQDQNLFVKEGDFIRHGDLFYEVSTLVEGRWLFGKVENQFEVVATCIRSRESLFDGT